MNGVRLDDTASRTPAACPPVEPTQAGTAFGAINQLSGKPFKFDGAPTQAPTCLDLVGFVRMLEPEIRQALGPHGDIVLTFGSPNCFAFVDPARLREIITGLVHNATCAMPNGGRLIIEVLEVTGGPASSDESLEPLSPGRYARLAVIDSGTGLNQRTQARRFEPSFANTRSDGTRAFSLAAAQQTVKRVGGAIRVESSIVAGTAVEIFLPCLAVELQVQ